MTDIRREMSVQVQIKSDLFDAPFKHFEFKGAVFEQIKTRLKCISDNKSNLLSQVCWLGTKWIDYLALESTSMFKDNKTEKSPSKQSIL